MTKITVSAPGKVHLLGEHAIVYDKPAILTAINKRCLVTLTPHKNSKINKFVPDGINKFVPDGIKITSKQLNKTLEISPAQIIARQKDAEEKWQEYNKTKDTALLKSITQNDLDLVVIAIGEALKYLGVKKIPAFDLEIDSQIPTGAGLGSSAAVAVSTIGALFLSFGENLDKEKINETAYLVEQKRHGRPSGGDNSTVTFGGLVWFRKETEELKIIKPLPFSVPDDLAQNFVLIGTGRPKESTGEMVAEVRKLVNKRPKWAEKIFNDQEVLVKKLYLALKENNELVLTETIKLGEKNLERVGVVSNFTRNLIRDIEKMGGVAKICGGGGVKDKSGVILAYHSEPRKVTALAEKLNLSYWQSKLGEEGVRVENG